MEEHEHDHYQRLPAGTCVHGWPKDVGCPVCDGECGICEEPREGDCDICGRALCVECNHGVIGVWLCPQCREKAETEVAAEYPIRAQGEAG